MIEIKSDYFKFLNKKSPCIIYDLNIIEDILIDLKNCLRNIHINYSVKANYHPTLLKFLSEQNVGFDVASIFEFNQATNFSNEITATSPSFSNHELIDLISNGVKVDFDNLEQIKSIPRNLVKGIRIKICIEEYEENTYLNNSHFGIDLLENLSVIAEYNIERIHFHVGEIPNPSIFKKIIDYIENILEEFENIKEINIGGGFTRIYNNRIEWNEFCNLMNAWKERHLDRSFYIEPGMLLVGPAGFLLTEIVSINKSDIILNTSAWNLFSWYIPKMIANTSKHKDTRKYRVFGNSCYEKDIFNEEIDTNILSVGDKLIYYPVGAYVTSMKKNLHNFPRIQEDFYYKGEIYG